MTVKTAVMIALGSLVFAAGSAEAKQYYRYTDEKGGVHYVEDPLQAPTEYRDRVVEAGKEIQIEPSADPLERARNRALKLWDRLTQATQPGPPELSLPPMGVLGLTWYTLRRTSLFYGLAVEAVAFLLFLAAYYHAQAYSSAQRRGYRLSLSGAYLALLLSSSYFLLLPQLKAFLYQIEVNAHMSASSGDLAEGARARMETYRDFAREWAERLP